MAKKRGGTRPEDAVSVSLDDIFASWDDLSALDEILASWNDQLDEIFASWNDSALDDVKRFGEHHWEKLPERHQIYRSKVVTHFQVCQPRRTIDYRVS